jgi:Cell wall-active antibiotics response 4TMS YvqF
MCANRRRLNLVVRLQEEGTAMNDHDVVRSADQELPSRATEPSLTQSAGRRWIVSIFGDITRAGSWPPRRTTSPFALFGDIDLDVRHAAIPVDGLVINAIAPFGNIDVTVPDGTEVDVGGFTLFGSKKVAVDGSNETASATVIRVRGFTLFGSLKVRSS